MNAQKIYLASDNWAPAHPLILQAIAEANVGYSPAYGSDPLTAEMEKTLLSTFKRVGKVFFVPNGTGANVLALNIACKKHESVICSDIAHIHYQESGATEALVGCKLLTVPHQMGKITPQEILRKLKSEKAFGKHSTSPRVVSITQPTELGTVYTLEELRELSAFCRQEKLLLHVDGSRLYNAAVALGVSLGEMLEDVSVDVLSLGGTKIGLFGAESLLIFNPDLQEGSDHLQKQMLLLLSKTRFLAAQYKALFEDQLWKKLAEQANQRARQIAKIIEKTLGLSLCVPVETNQVFFAASKDIISFIQEHAISYLWDQEKNEVRFIASWCTSEDDVRRLERCLADMPKKS